MTTDYVIGVDAGGTKTVAWLAGTAQVLDDAPVASASSGPGNVRSVGFETAVRNIHSAILGISAEVSIPIRTLCICAAGAGRRIDQTRLQEWGESLAVAENVLIRPDVEAVLASASPDQTGVALISGTGSLAWGRNADGQTRRAGGWGYLMGDEGSAYDIARRALQCASQMADGRREKTPLLPVLLDALKLQHASELVPVIYGASQPKHEIAQLAVHVFACAAKGDTVSEAIIADAANSLSAMVAAVTRKLHLPADCPLAIAGSVLIHQHMYRQRVMNSLHRSDESATLVEQPVRGAVRVAQMATS